MDSALISQIGTTLLTLLVTYGAVYFGQYRVLLRKFEHFVTDFEDKTSDGVVTPTEVDELRSDFEDLRTEFLKALPQPNSFSGNFNQTYI